MEVQSLTDFSFQKQRANKAEVCDVYSEIEKGALVCFNMQSCKA